MVPSGTPWAPASRSAHRSRPWRLGRTARCTPGGPSPQPAGCQPTASPAGTAPSGIPWAPGWIDYVEALAVGPDGSLYAGGVFTTAGGVAANYTARWDGTQWNSLGSGMDDLVYALAVGPDGLLYAGGWFTTAGEVAANDIARWDGAQWHPLESGMNVAVDALAIGPDGLLYAGGWFTTAGEVAANRIARWDGAQWHPVSVFSGNGMDGLVCALALDPDGSLYAGGSFRELARFQLAASPDGTAPSGIPWAAGGLTRSANWRLA